MDNSSLSRRVAVTGSTGMIGSHLVTEMVRAGYSDIVLPVRSRERVSNLRAAFDRLGVGWPGEKALTVVETGLADPESLSEVFAGVDTVFDCAGAIMTGNLTRQQLIDNNVSIARGIAQASVVAGVRRILHTSSIVVLAPTAGTADPVTEDAYPHGDAHNSAYACSKYLADIEMKRAAEAGIDLRLLYPAVVLGEGDWSADGSSALIPLIASGVPFYSDGVMAYVDVRDVARAYIAIDGCPFAAGGGYIVAGGNFSYRELITMGSRAAGKPTPFIKVGRPLALTAYGILCALMALGLVKNRNLTRSEIDIILRGSRYSGQKLSSECGFVYTPIGRTVERLVKAYLEDKKGKGDKGKRE